tara:strand:- start:128 stop:784 length:657 start_codon:yes stop_codon:yes gene_type:complete
MHLHIKNNNEFIKCFHSESIQGLNKATYKLDFINKKVSAILYCNEEKITCDELLALKESLMKCNITLTNIYSSSREIVIAAQSLKINCTFFTQNNFENIVPHIKDNYDKNDLTHFGMVRSGDQISSNGNLFIIGDVNPGAQISAKKNIYVWGKLCGVAFAGKNGDNDSTISSLYLNPLQLRINMTVAIGPKEKPKNNYPEIALLEEGKIVIKPLLINS